MPRKSHEPTDKTRAEVSALASFGVPAEDICEYIGVSRNTLWKYYSEELATAHTKANAAVAKFLFTGASGKALADGATYADCYRAAMFWMKTRGRWSEKHEVDVTTNGESLNLPVSELSDDQLASIARNGK